jgi:hypothetical protein
MGVEDHMVNGGCRLRHETCTARCCIFSGVLFPNLFFMNDGLIGFDELVGDMDVRMRAMI